jgi:hypoxanthine phosphoribosyltransferase
MKINTIFILIVLILLHYCILNGLEKIFFQIVLNHIIILRPFKKTDPLIDILNVNVEYLGLPSGHAEIIVFLSLFLVKFKYISIPISIILIILVCLQRIITYRHALLQVIIGVLFGLVYSYLYNITNYSYKSIIINILFINLFIILIYYKIEGLLNEPIPNWIDNSMLDKIREKKNSPFYLKYISILHPAIFQSGRLYMNWEQLEKYLNVIIQNIEDSNITYDAVVGIKTGGAIISDYISKKLNLKNYKIKISTKENKCNKKSIDTIKTCFDLYILKKKKEYIVCEGLDDNISNQNIILIDESIASGGTISKAIDYLVNDKKINNIYITSVLSNIKSINNYNLNSVKFVKYIDLIWPWGYDN